jgi:DNA-binding IclR family transcriptional regulator
MLRVLDLIEESPSPLTSDDMAGRLGFTRSTLYRHLKNLSDAGLVTSFPDVGYALGPRVAELDYKMRNSDPLIIASRPVMAELVDAIPGIALLCRRYRDQVLCVHQESRNADFATTYERGKALPLFRGAASRIILAHLPQRSIQRLYEADRQAFAEGRLGKSLDAVRSALKHMRQRGWDITESQVTRGVTGVAAPVFDDRGGVLGSLSLTVGRTKLADGEIRAVAERVTFCARIVTKALFRSSFVKNPII